MAAVERGEAQRQRFAEESEAAQIVGDLRGEFGILREFFARRRKLSFVAGRSRRAMRSRPAAPRSCGRRDARTRTAAPDRALRGAPRSAGARCATCACAAQALRIQTPSGARRWSRAARLFPGDRSPGRLRRGLQFRAEIEHPREAEQRLEDIRIRGVRGEKCAQGLLLFLGVSERLRVEFGGGVFSVTPGPASSAVIAAQSSRASPARRFAEQKSRRAVSARNIRGASELACALARTR